jgi:hypothetical protein
MLKCVAAPLQESKYHHQTIKTQKKNRSGRGGEKLLRDAAAARIER